MNAAPAARCAWLFPGQGTQRPGMATTVVGLAPAAEVFECASDVFGFDVVALCTTADAAALDETRAAQAAVATTSLALVAALRAREVEPAAFLGFSLGQISALGASHALSLEDTFTLLDVRARCMDEALREAPGAMCALLGADQVCVQALCDECAQGEVLVIANYNCPGQIVISGSCAAIERATTAWSAQGKRSARLACAGAFHSPLMAPAARAFSDFLATCTFAQPCAPLICNTDATALDAATLRRRLADHLTQPVRFSQGIASLNAQEITSFLEVGTGGVLTNLVRRIDKNLNRSKLETAADLEAIASA
ncbi:MAG: ACP S-malonyltransferase [Raoultibacter sp.]